jgi:hypothetical protein
MASNICVAGGGMIAYVFLSDVENSGDVANAAPVWMWGVCLRNRLIQDHHDVSAYP